MLTKRNKKEITLITQSDSNANVNQQKHHTDRLLKISMLSHKFAQRLQMIISWFVVALHITSENAFSLKKKEENGEERKITQLSELSVHNKHKVTFK